jgi:hypothetical protein
MVLLRDGLILAVVGVLALPAAAPASETIGQNGTPVGCSDDLAYVQAAEAPGTPRYTPSSYGVITSWTGMTAGTPSTLQLLIAKPDPASGPHNFVIVRRDAVRTLAALNALNSFSGLRIPIEAGERLGMYVPSQIAGGYCEFAGSSGDSLRFPLAGGNPPDNTSIDFSQEAIQQRLNASAVVEPDTDRDVFGDETQDNCVGTAGQFNGCPNTFTIGKVKQKGTKPKVKVSATLPGAGTLKAGSPSDPALAAASAKTSLKPVTQALTAKTQQQVTLTLKLSKSAKRKLADKGKLKLQVKLSYTPTGGPAGSQTAKAKLKS